MSGHLPVMLDEVVESIAPRDGAIYVDGTFGGGGYSRALLEAAKCRVLAIDLDPDAIARGRELAARYDGRLMLFQGPFSAMESFLAQAGAQQSDGVVLDLGVSSFQFDQAERGFSFAKDGPLDMRMSREGESAADLVNSADEKTLTGLISRYGEERQARRVARAIVAARPFSRTAALAEVVSKALGPAAAREKIHPATRTFQALRIAVNDELGELERGLAAAERVLADQGRLAVVAFHSLEDRIVKQFLLEHSTSAPTGSRHAPETRRATASFRLLHSRPRMASAAEIERNPRARSARLRAGIRIRVAA
jgi:16S rRNA (cytosine1402-N4)-methyltransferase